MSCSWTYNWISNNEKIYLYPCDCYANFPIIHEIRPGEKISFNGIIHVLDTLKSFNEYELKLGCIIVKEKEVIKDSDFLKVLDYKISEQKDIIWSEPFKVNELKSLGSLQRFRTDTIQDNSYNFNPASGNLTWSKYNLRE